MSRACTWLLAAAILVTGAVARADDTEEARKNYEDGLRAMEAGQYEEAEKLFTRGYELTHKAGFLWNMAESARLRGDSERARKLYHRYLDGSPSGAKTTETLERLKGLPPPPPGSLLAENEPRRVDVDYSNAKDDRKKPLRKKWWFWTATAAVIVGGTVATIVIVKNNQGSSRLGTPSGATLDPVEGPWD